MSSNDGKVELEVSDENAIRLLLAVLQPWVIPTHLFGDASDANA
jgi:hypothetical protein